MNECYVSDLTDAEVRNITGKFRAEGFKNFSLIKGAQEDKQMFDINYLQNTLNLSAGVSRQIKHSLMEVSVKEVRFICKLL